MYLIDDRFTRLEPGGDFRKLDPALGLGVPEALEFLAQVPDQWCDIHDPLLVAHWSDRVALAIRHPVHIEKHPCGHRHVMVLGDAIYDIAPEGTVTCFAWRYDKDSHIRLRAFPDDEILAIGAPYEGLWMKGYAHAALQRLCHAHPPDLHARCADYVDWLMDQMLAEHWKREAAVSVRRQVAEALRMDPTLQALAASMCRAYDPKVVRLSEYNHCARNRARIERLQQEAPDLALLHSLLYQDLSLELEPTQAMAKLLEERGIGRGVWRLLVYQGSEWMRPFLGFYRIPFGEGPAVALDILSLVQMFGTQELIPYRVLNALMAVGGNPNLPRKSPTYAQEFSGVEDLVARLGHLYFNGSLGDRLSLMGRCDAIVGWGLDHWAERSLRSRHTIQLVGLLREIKSYERRHEMVHRDRKPWSIPWTLISNDPQFEIQIRGSALALWKESKIMRHCADKYIERCARGQYLIASIRPTGCSSDWTYNCTTVGFIHTAKGFFLNNISGFANARVTGCSLAIARDCLRQLNRQMIQLALREPREDVVEEEATGTGSAEVDSKGELKERAA